MTEEIDDETMDQIEGWIQQIVDYQQKTFELSAAYNQVIVLGGYAAFFAVWSATVSSLPAWAVLLTGGLILFSAIFYIGWTVANMIVMSRRSVEMMKAINEGPVTSPKLMLEVENKHRRIITKLMGFWMPVVLSAGLSALAAALILTVMSLSAAIGHLV